MGDFAAGAASNLGAGVEETDSTGGLFSPGYLFGVPVLDIENDPGAAIAPVATPAPPDDTNWVTDPQITEPTPIASTRQEGADSCWKLWPAAAGSVAISLPDGTDVRSLWVPVIPVAMNISLGFAGGAIMYGITLTGGEVVPIPKGCKLLTISANSQAVKPDIWIFATHDVFPPNKTAVTGPPIPISGQLSPYDNMILGTSGLLYYWPCSDANGSLQIADYGPQKLAAIPQGNLALGGMPLLSDGTTSATLDGGASTNILCPAPAAPGIGSAAPWTYELWFLESALGAGPNSACCLLDAGSGTAGPQRTGILRTNNDLALGVFSSDSGFKITQVVHYLCVTYDGANTKYYIDGNVVGTGGTTGNFDLSHGVVVGGSTNNGNGQDGIAGNVSKIAFYGRVLAANEIAARQAFHK